MEELEIWIDCCVKISLCYNRKHESTQYVTNKILRYFNPTVNNLSLIFMSFENNLKKN